MIEIMSIFLYQILAPFATESRISAKITQNGDYYDTWDSGDEIPVYGFKKGG